MSRLPDFVIGGAQKCGTTRLHNLLMAHPALYLPRRPQELHYYDLQHDRGRDWYASHFTGARDDQKVGQTSPLYLFHERVAERMWADMPSSKLIFVLRNPVDRAYSHYWHQVKKSSEVESFERALDLEEERVARGGADLRRFSYRRRGLYKEQLDRFSARWPEAQIRIVLFERFVQEPAVVVDEICDYLGVARAGAHCVAKSRKQSNRAALPRSRRVQRLVRRLRGRAPYMARAIELLNLKPTRYPMMSASVRQRLAEEFREPNRALAERYRLDLDGWTTPTPT